MAEELSGKGLNTIVGKGSTFEGSLNVLSSVRVEGIIKGNIQCSETLTVGREGMLEANVNVKSAIISGKVVGNINASGKVELDSTASLYGDIVATQLVINEGAFFNGRCDMNKGTAF